MLKDGGPITWTDAALDERCRPLFVKIIGKAEELIDLENWSTERVMALAELANAVACGMHENDDE